MCEKCAELCSREVGKTLLKVLEAFDPRKYKTLEEREASMRELYGRIARDVRRAGRLSECPDAVKGATLEIERIRRLSEKTRPASAFLAQSGLRAAEDASLWEGQCEEYVTTHGHDGYGAQAAVTRTSRCMHNRPCPVHKATMLERRVGGGMQKVKVVYIAGPFRADSAWAVECNIRKAEEAALEIWRTGLAAALCPHTNTRFFQGAAPDDVWLRGTLELLRRCDAILLISGWKSSTGSVAERDLAEGELQLPVFTSLQACVDWLGSDEDRKAEKK